MDKAASPVTMSFFICVGELSPSLMKCIRSLDLQKTNRNTVVTSVSLVWNTTEKEMLQAQSRVDTWIREENISIPVTHYVEPQRGIPFSRNTALTIARKQNLSWVAFIDDDCIADADLAQTFADVATKHRPTAIAGGWEIIPETTPSPWIPEAVFGVKHYQLGGKDAPGYSVIPTAYTRNVAFNLTEVDRIAGQDFVFDTQLATTGGSDAKFFFGVSRAGGKIIYAPDAKVTETYAGERLTLAWHFRRRIRNTQQKILRARTTREKAVNPALIFSALGKLAWRLPLSLLVLPLAMRSHRVRRWIGSTMLTTSPLVAGGLLLCGIRFHEYARKDRWGVFR